MPAVDTIPYDSVPDAPGQEPGKAGYSFDAWYDYNTMTQEYGSKYGFDEALIANRTLYVMWNTESDVEVTYDANAGGDSSVDKMPTSPVEVSYNGFASEPPETPTRDSYTFEGWYTTPEANIPFDFTMTRVTEATKTLYAGWTYTSIPGSTRYSLSYDLNLPADTVNDGGEPALVRITAGQENPITPPSGASLPLVVGYELAGWYTAPTGGVEFNFENGANNPGDNITVYAQWTQKEPIYSIKYRAGAGVTNVSDLPGTLGSDADGPYGLMEGLSYNQIIEHPDAVPSRTGYTFVGWCTDAGGETPFSFDNARITENIPIYAKWQSQDEVTVEFVPGLSSGDIVSFPSPAAVYVDYGGYATKPATSPSAIGYEFDGWKVSSASDADDFDFAATPITGTTPIYASWEQKADVTLSFNAGVPPETQTVASGIPSPKTFKYNGLMPSSETLGEPSLTGYTFAGWWSEAGEAGVQYTPGVTRFKANTPVYAHWNVAGSINVGFNAGIATFVNPPDEQSVAYGGRAERPDPNPMAEGYSFEGWYKDASLTTLYDFTSEVYAPTTIYAKWNQEDEVTLTYDANEVDLSQTVNGMPAPVTVNYAAIAAAVAPTSPTSIGYAFGGWYTHPTDGSLYTGFGSRLTSNTTIYARWTPKADCEVAFNLNLPVGSFDAWGVTAELVPASPIPEQTGIPVGGIVTEPAAPAIVKGWEFKGWYKDIACEYEFNFSTDTVSADRTTLYAGWDKMGSAVTFDAGSQSPDYEPGEKYELVPVNMAIPAPATPVSDAYTFKGWYTQPSGGGAEYRFDVELVTGNITLYADWEINKYNVSFSYNQPIGIAPQPNTLPGGIPNVTHGSIIGEVAIPALMDDGQGFAYWSKDSAGAQMFDPLTDEVTGSMTLYAQWHTYYGNKEETDAASGVEVLGSFLYEPTEVSVSAIAAGSPVANSVAAKYDGSDGALSGYNYSKGYEVDAINVDAPHGTAVAKPGNQITVNLPVPAGNNGKDAIVLHMFQASGYNSERSWTAGDVESFKVTVSGSYVTVRVDAFSPFTVYIKKPPVPPTPPPPTPPTPTPPTPPAPNYPAVSAIKTPIAKLSVVAGKKLNLKKMVGLYDKAGKPISDPGLKWTSSKPTVASVSAAGGAVKAGKKAGKTVITAAAQNGRTLKITISVVKKAKKLKKLSGKVPKLKVGKPAYITLKGAGTNITGYKWKVKGKGLKIDKFGMATASKKGKYTITATAGGKKWTKKVTVK
jgi:uncharacterized repeat protein (TIGR02543 family)